MPDLNLLEGFYNSKEKWCSIVILNINSTTKVLPRLTVSRLTVLRLSGLDPGAKFYFN